MNKLIDVSYDQCASLETISKGCHNIEIKPLIEMILKKALGDDVFLSSLIADIDLEYNEKEAAKEDARLAKEAAKDTALEVKKLEREERRKMSIEFAIEKQKSLLAFKTENQKNLLLAKAKAREELAAENVRKAKLDIHKERQAQKFKECIKYAVYTEARKVDCFKNVSNTDEILNDHYKGDIDMLLKMIEVINPAEYITEQCALIKDNWIYYIKTNTPEQEYFINKSKTERYEKANK
jgi:hypothetical protein